MEFDEGDFTEAKDMKDLGDQNLRDLRVKAGDLIVHLGERRAEAIGPPALTEFVHNAWARSRQSARYPASWGWSQRYPYRTAPVVFGLFAVGLGIFLYPSVVEVRQVLAFIAVVLLLSLLGWILYRSNKLAFDTTTWAAIRPLTAHEIRDEEQRKTTVPLWALVVSILAFVVSTTFLILEYVKPGP